MKLYNHLPPGAKDFVDRHPKFQLALKSFSYLFSERMFKIVIGFFIHALLARHLGPDHFGKLSYVVKTVTVFFSFGLFGVDELIIKYLMEGEYQEEDVLKTVLMVRLKMSLIGFLSLGAFLLVFQPGSLLFTLITFAYGINIFFQIFNVYELVFHSRMDFRPVFWANNFSYISASLLRVLGIILNTGITFFLATYLWGEIVLKFLILKKVGFKRAFSGKYLPHLSKIISRKSFPFLISSFVILLDQRLSFLFIEKYLSLTELGNYSVAVSLVDIWLFLPTALASAVFPTIVTAYSNHKPKYEIRIQYLSDVLVWSALAFSVGVFISSEIVIRSLYGERYVDASRILALFSVTAIPIFFNLGRIKWMTLENQLNEWLYLSGVCLALNFIGHIFLVPLYGVEGAILSYLLSQVLGNLMMSIPFQSNRKSLIMFAKTITFPLRFFNKIR